ncbi:MAG: hypothetical protein JEY96_03320 [Bacteroidales bacterium]|nr:hypothetical protein [Bacteroidales bacterium]
MIRIIFLILPFMLFLSCKTTEEIQTVTKLSINEPIMINIPEKISVNDTLTIEIQNITSDIIILVNPVIKNIEKFSEGNWVLQRIRYCPCGADCHQAIPRMELTSDRNFSVDWNLNESWCVKTESEIWKKQISKVSPGLYRVIVKYEKVKYQTQTIYKEFEITN